MIPIPHSNVPTLDDARVIEACRAAAEAEVGYAMAAMIAGQLLIEKRHSLQMTSHDGKSSWTDRTKPESAQFGAWLETSGIARNTAYRWMDCAERVLRLHLGLTLGDDYVPFIEIGGQVVPHSQVLTMPEAELPEAARKLRQDVFDFMEDKTLGEAARAAFGGDSPSHRITRAGGGRLRGGTHASDDRKSFHKFVAKKLKEIDSHLAHWDSMTPVQRAEITSVVVAAMSGETFKPAGMAPVAFALWPEALCEAMAEALRLRLRARR